MIRLLPRIAHTTSHGLVALGALVLAEALVAEAAWAQPAEQPAPGPDAAADDASTVPETGAAADDSLEGYAPPGPPTGTPEGEADQDTGQPVQQSAAGDPPVEPATDEPPPAPPPGPPVATEQDPKPVPLAEASATSRRVHLGFYAGVSHRSSASDSISFGPAFAYGPSAAIDLARWLRFEIYARFENIPVDVGQGGFDWEDEKYPDTSFEQSDLDSIGLGFRLAPTWMVLDQLGLQAFFDLAWNRFTAAAPSTSGASEIRSAERAGVGLNYKFGLGVVAEPILDWLELSAAGSIGTFTGQTGTAYEELQGFDQSGYIVHLGPFPKFERSLELLFTVALIL
jgi:hypothetical protein